MSKKEPWWWDDRIITAIIAGWLFVIALQLATLVQLVSGSK